MGDCFQAAARILIDGEFGEEAVLVHGLPLGTGKLNAGERYWHAWVECGDRVVDRSAGKDLNVPREWYYQLGQIETTWRYTRQEAGQLMITRKNWGPWVAGWESMGL